MTIEQNIFNRTIFDNNKLKKYGFVDNKYVINILNNSFRVELIIDKELIGKIYDNEFNEEYTNYRIESMNGEYVSKIRNEYINILNDIKNKCTIKKYFIYDQSNRLAEQIKKEYNTDPEFLWDRTPGTGVFRNNNTSKWFGIIMDIDGSKIGLKKGIVEVLNIKIEQSKVKELINEKSYFPAYHMNKKYWITILLNDSIKDNEILELIKESYNYSK